MSGKQAGKVWDADVSGNVRILLLAMADQANHDGGDCYPSVERLVWMTGLGERTVKRFLAQLREAGIIEAVAHLGGGRGYATEYQLRFERLPQKQPFVPKRKKGANAAPLTRKQRVPSAAERVPTGPKRVPLNVAPPPFKDPEDRPVTPSRALARTRAGGGGETLPAIVVEAGLSPRAEARMRRTAERLGAELVHERPSPGRRPA